MHRPPFERPSSRAPQTLIAFVPLALVCGPRRGVRVGRRAAAPRAPRRGRILDLPTVKGDFGTKPTVTRPRGHGTDHPAGLRPARRAPARPSPKGQLVAVDYLGEMWKSNKVLRHLVRHRQTPAAFPIGTGPGHRRLRRRASSARRSAAGSCSSSRPRTATAPPATPTRASPATDTLVFVVDRARRPARRRLRQRARRRHAAGRRPPDGQHRQGQADHQHARRQAAAEDPGRHRRSSAGHRRHGQVRRPAHRPVRRASSGPTARPSTPRGTAARRPGSGSASAR